jgi:predicted nucleotidyltransferase
MATPIEGYFLETNEGLIFEVKGNVHPSDCYIAYLRYVIDSSGDRVSESGSFYKKVYPLEDRQIFLQHNYPQFLRFDKQYNRVLQVVQLDDVRYVLNPIDALNRFKDLGRHGTDLQYSTLELAEKLVETSGISWDSIGVTGSQMVGLATEESDIDLVVYGENNGTQLHSELRKRYEVIEGIQRYTGESLRRHVEFRWGITNPNVKILQHIEGSKVLQGIFNGYDFFIRLVKKPREESYNYFDRKYHPIGTRVLKCRILDDSQAIFTPCEYKAKCEGVSDFQAIVSYRGRYTEQVRKGTDVEVNGRMERVVHIDGNQWIQLVLGESDTDYLIPLDL